MKRCWKYSLVVLAVLILVPATVKIIRKSKNMIPLLMPVSISEGQTEEMLAEYFFKNEIPVELENLSIDKNGITVDAYIDRDILLHCIKEKLGGGSLVPSAVRKILPERISVDASVALEKEDKKSRLKLKSIGVGKLDIYENALLDIFSDYISLSLENMLLESGFSLENIELEEKYLKIKR